ncbi:MAG: DUF3450 domain-containing protein [Deltaproteobacteria bacterium]|nr:DUF3450 domain-containing protein [Deltaproteobacteria bacterium]
MRHIATSSCSYCLALAGLLALAAAPIALAATAPPADHAAAPTAAATATAPAQAAPLSVAPQPPSAEKLERAGAEQIGTDKEAHASQERINNLDDEIQKLLSEYRRALADAESHAAYADQLAAQIASQNGELSAIQAQLDEVEATARAVTPLQQRMLETLKQFVALDVPFLLEERTKRVATLEEMMTRADVTISEKYRRILEAYQVEMDYGRTIEAYEARLGDRTEDRTARFLRVGRVSLLYQTLDGHETGYWDAQKKDWVVDNHYAHAFKEGVAVAQKLRAPEMLVVPVPAPREAKS